MESGIVKDKSTEKEFWKKMKSEYLKLTHEEKMSSMEGPLLEAVVFFFYKMFSVPIFDLSLDSFKEKYIYNETKIECPDEDDEHCISEQKGLAAMYEYIENYSTSKEINTFMELIKLHKMLYSCSPCPEIGGTFRSSMAYFLGGGVEPPPAEMIYTPLFSKVAELDKIASRPIDTSERRIKYISECVMLGTDILKIHPFPDGNGRSIRGLINLLFKHGNIPPVYVTVDDKPYYLKALQKAQIHEDYQIASYDEIINFYFYKICESLVALEKIVNGHSVDSEGVKIYYIGK